MAVRISQLPTAVSIAEEDWIPIVQNNETKKIAASLVGTGGSGDYATKEELQEIGFQSVYLTESLSDEVIEIDISQDVSIFEIALDSDGAEISFTGSMIEPDVSNQITLILINTDGAGQVTWDDNIKWSNGFEPILTFQPGGIDVVSILITPNNVLGFSVGSNF